MACFYRHVKILTFYICHSLNIYSYKLVLKVEKIGLFCSILFPSRNCSCRGRRQTDNFFQAFSLLLLKIETTLSHLKYYLFLLNFMPRTFYKNEEIMNLSSKNSMFKVTLRSIGLLLL